MSRPFVVIVLAILLSFSAGCANFGDTVSAILFPKTKNTFERKGEVVEIEFVYTNGGNAPPQPPGQIVVGGEGLQAQAALGAGEIAAVAGFLVEQAAEYLKKEAERYSATYSGVAVGDQFYGEWTERDANNAVPVNLERIVIKRKVEAGDGITVELAVDETVDGTAFQLRPTKVHLDRAKAKLAAFALLDPTSWFSGKDKDLDLTVALGMQSVWVDAKGDLHVKELADGEFKIRKLELGKSYDNAGTDKVPGGSFVGQLVPMPPRSYLGKHVVAREAQLDANGLVKFVESAHPPAGTKINAWTAMDADQRVAALGLQAKAASSGGAAAAPGMAFYDVPISEPVLGLGNIIVTVLVTEHDDYGKRVKEVSDKVAAQKDKVVDAVEKALAKNDDGK